jgi:hypothetical protein
VAPQRNGVKRLIGQLWEIYPQIAATRERIVLREGAPGDQTLYMTEQIPMKKQQSAQRLVSQAPVDGPH